MQTVSVPHCIKAHTKRLLYVKYNAENPLDERIFAFGFIIIFYARHYYEISQPLNIRRIFTVKYHHL